MLFFLYSIESSCNQYAMYEDSINSLARIAKIRSFVNNKMQILWISLNSGKFENKCGGNITHKTALATRCSSGWFNNYNKGNSISCSFHGKSIICNKNIYFRRIIQLMLLSKKSSLFFLNNFYELKFDTLTTTILTMAISSSSFDNFSRLKKCIWMYMGFTQNIKINFFPIALKSCLNFTFL